MKISKDDEEDTVVLGIHVYRKDLQAFKAKCRPQRKFHSDVARDLILHYIQHEGKLEGTEVERFMGPEIGWVRETNREALEARIEALDRDFLEYMKRVERLEELERNFLQYTA